MEILRRINEIRNERRLSELSESVNMNMVAQTRALEMAYGMQPFSHRHKNDERAYIVGMLPGEKRVELIYANIADNQRGFSPLTDQSDASLVVSAWENSPSHLEGLLDLDVKSVGLGVIGRVVVAVFTNKT